MKSTYALPFRRKREGRTDYKARLKLLSSEKPRLVIRRSLDSIYAQLIKFQPDGDIVIASASSKDIAKLGWKHNKKNIPCAYLVGFLAGKRAKDKKISEAVLDAGLYVSIKGSRIYAAVKGAIDAGLKVPCSQEILPSEDRIKGKHIPNFDVKKFEETKKKILGA